MEGQRLLNTKASHRRKPIRDLDGSIDPTMTLREVMQTAPGAAELWDRLGVDICHRQNASFASVCRQQGLDPSTVARLLTALRQTSPRNRTIIVELLTLRELCDYIENTQHNCLKADLAEVDRLTRNAAHQYSSVWRVRKAFVTFCDQLAAHLHEEIDGLFPVIRRLASGSSRARLARGVKLRPRFARLEREHGLAEDAIEELISFVNDGTLNGISPVTTQALSAAVLRLRHSLAQQIYVENQVLFRRASAAGGTT